VEISQNARAAYYISMTPAKKWTRRWCSMQLSGNRLKVAAYAARRWHG
jgi:predicted RNA-binding Zn ribbon-like protein